MNKGGKPMTSREMVEDLMEECMDDARRIAAHRVECQIGQRDPDSPPLSVVATLAAAMFTARWAMMCHVGTEEPG